MEENQIRYYRKLAGLTQKKMAEVLEIPVRNIEDWERGLHSPPKWAKNLIIKELKRMAKAEK